MAEADSDSVATATEFAELLARQAAAVVELFSLSAESGDAQAGDEEAWVRSAERLDALWRHFAQDHTEAFVAAWPDFVRELTSLLPLVSRGQPLFAMLAQLLPLLVGPEALGRAIESRGESLVKGLEQFLADLHRSQITDADTLRTADGQGVEHAAGDQSGLARTLP